MTPVLSKDIEAEQIGDEMVIYHAITESAVHLNQTSRLIYSLIDGQRSTSEIVALLSEAFPEAPVADDVAQLMKELAEAQVITYA